MFRRPDHPTLPSQFACTRRRRSTAGLAFVTLAFLAACSSDEPTKPCVVSSVGVAPGTSTLAIGGTVQMAPSLTSSNCTTAPAVAWSTSSASVATVSASGLVTAVAPGTAVISAVAGGASGTATVTVTPPQPTSVRIAPDTVRLGLGDSLIVRGVATLANGTATTDPVIFTSSNPSIVSADPSGLLVARAAGIATVSGRSGAATGTVRVEVASGHVAPTGRVSGPTTFTVTSTEEEIAAGTLVLTRANPDIRFAPGDVLVGTESGGYLRKIVRVTTSGNSVTATTTEAELPEAFAAGDIEVEDDLSFANALEEEGSAPRIAGMTVDRDGVIHFNKAQLPFNIDVSGGTRGNPAQVIINLSGDLDFLSGKGKTGAPTFTLKDKWGSSNDFPWLPEIKSFELALTAGVRLAATVTGTITGANLIGSIPRSEVEILRRNLTRGTKCGLFGPIPVCYKVTAKLMAFVEPEAGPGAEFIQEMEYSSGGTAAVKYSNGRLTPSFKPFSSSNVPAPTVALRGDMSVKFGVKPVLEVSLYNSGGPDVGIPVGVELSGGLENLYQWYVQPDFFADIALGLQAKVFGFSLRGEWENNLISRPLARASGPLATLSVTPATFTVGQGQTRSLTANARSILGNANLGTPARLTWTSSRPAVATVNSSGVVTGVTVGTATITATIPGTTISDQSAVTVQAVALVEDVVVSPSTVSMIVGATRTMTGHARRNGAPVPTSDGALTWSSNAPNVVSVTPGAGPPNPTATLTALAAGSATVCARSVIDPSKQDCTAVTSTQPIAGSVTVSVEPQLKGGQQVTATATVRDPNGVVLPNYLVTWTGTNSAVAVVGITTGIVTALSQGTAEIIATAGGIQGRATVTVDRIPAASLLLTVGSSTIGVRSTTQAIATPRDATGNALSGRAVTFVSSDPAVATIDQAGVITGVSTGTTTITATCEGISRAVTITVVPPAALALVSTVPANGATNISIESPVRATFSQNVNAATVNNTTFRVTQSGAVVAGTFAVSGATVTFTPSSPLGENDVVSLSLTTGLGSSAGTSLANGHSGSFKTVMFDPNYYYRFFNGLTGQANSLDTYNITFHGFMGATGGFTGQFWYVTPAPGYPGYYLMRNQFQGNNWYLEGTNGVDPVELQNTAPVIFSGQLWQFFGSGFGPGCFFLQNQNFGATKSMANVGGSVIMQPTALTAAQCFIGARVGRR